MKGPHGIIPFRVENGRHIIDATHTVIAAVSNSDDAFYMVQATNKYEDAIALIKSYVDQVEADSIQSRVTYNKFRIFLNSINRYGNED